MMRWWAKEKADPRLKITTEHMSRPGECCGFLQSQNDWAAVGGRLGHTSAGLLEAPLAGGEKTAVGP